MKIIAVVITYNRLELLKECIAAIKDQTRTADEIVVINNSSTDGTDDWLKQQQVIRIFTQPNRGGSWGFMEGIKQAWKLSGNWIWVMDDDTIPYTDALQNLVNAVELAAQQNDRFGFLGSRVVWKNGELHLMNKQQETINPQGYSNLSLYLSNNIIPVNYNSFVSILINSEAVQKTGLPIKEFFIWNDDFEYTIRILKHGFKGALVNNSLALHKTPVNYSSDIFTDTGSNLWKHRHRIRNELYIRRKYKGTGSFIRNILKNIFVLSFKILIKRKNTRFKFIKTVIGSSVAAISFNPVVEFPE